MYSSEISHDDWPQKDNENFVVTLKTVRLTWGSRFRQPQNTGLTTVFNMASFNYISLSVHFSFEL